MRFIIKQRIMNRNIKKWMIINKEWMIINKEWIELINELRKRMNR